LHRFNLADELCSMTSLPATLLRPAKVSEVRAPGILLQVGKYGAPFLVAGDKGDLQAIFLDGSYKFRSFKLAKAENWSGLAVEDIEFDLDLESGLNVSGYGRSPGSMLRSGSLLSIAAIADDAFGRTIDIPILTNLPGGSDNERTAFYSWRAFVMVGDHQRIVWESKIPFERDW